MLNLVKHVEGRATHFIVPLDKMFDDHAAYLDASDAIFEAMRRDRKLGYGYENGPHYAIERNRAEEYAAYVAGHAIKENLHKFDTRQYRCFQSAVTEEQANANKRATR